MNILPCRHKLPVFFVSWQYLLYGLLLFQNSFYHPLPGAPSSGTLCYKSMLWKVQLFLCFCQSLFLFPAVGKGWNIFLQTPKALSTRGSLMLRSEKHLEKQNVRYDNIKLFYLHFTKKKTWKPLPIVDSEGTDHVSPAVCGHTGHAFLLQRPWGQSIFQTVGNKVTCVVLWEIGCL